MSLTARQALLLRSSAKSWVNIALSRARKIQLDPAELLDQIRAAQGQLEVTTETVDRILDASTVNIHVVALALRHVARALSLLIPHLTSEPELLEAATRFSQEYESADMQNFRDVLEHSAEYIADRGHKPALKKAEGPGYGATIVDDVVVGVHVFGETYDMRRVLERAQELLPLL